jgi:hypothetical protein
MQPRSLARGMLVTASIVYPGGSPEKALCTYNASWGNLTARCCRERLATDMSRLELRAGHLPKRHIERHHDGEAYHERHGGEVSVAAFLGLGDQLLDDEDHGSGSEGQCVGQQRRG